MSEQDQQGAQDDPGMDREREIVMEEQRIGAGDVGSLEETLGFGTAAEKAGDGEYKPGDAGLGAEQPSAGEPASEAVGSTLTDPALQPKPETPSSSEPDPRESQRKSNTIAVARDDADAAVEFDSGPMGKIQALREMSLIERDCGRSALADLFDEMASLLASNSCLANLEPAEPFFVLVAHDQLAAECVRKWAARAEGRKVRPEKVSGARAIADAMDAWPTHRLPA